MHTSSRLQTLSRHYMSCSSPQIHPCFDLLDSLQYKAGNPSIVSRKPFWLVVTISTALQVAYRVALFPSVAVNSPMSPEHTAVAQHDYNWFQLLLYSAPITLEP